MVHHLEYDHKHVILVGTAHVSKESAEQVTRVIQEESPDTVCVELCQSRYQSIRQKERWQETDIVKIIKEKKSFAGRRRTSSKLLKKRNRFFCSQISYWHRFRNGSLKN
jgi:pheromone shutdown protein TraB